MGKQVSYNKISKILGISNDSVKAYIGYFRDAYLFHIIEKDARSLNERIIENKKGYCADVGIRNVTSGFRDLGSIYENLVYLKIRKENPRYMKKDGAEIDFILKDTIIEAKYGQKLSSLQERLFKNAKAKNKIMAEGVDFFIKDRGF